MWFITKTFIQKARSISKSMNLVLECYRWIPNADDASIVPPTLKLEWEYCTILLSNEVCIKSTVN